MSHFCCVIYIFTLPLSGEMKWRAWPKEPENLLTDTQIWWKDDLLLWHISMTYKIVTCFFLKMCVFAAIFIYFFSVCHLLLTFFCFFVIRGNIEVKELCVTFIYKWNYTRHLPENCTAVAPVNKYFILQTLCLINIFTLQKHKNLYSFIVV